MTDPVETLTGLTERLQAAATAAIDDERPTRPIRGDRLSSAGMA